MSVENKIKELLVRSKQTGQQLTEESTEKLAEGEMVAAAQKAAAATSKDTSKAASAASAGDTSQPKQGSSEVPSVISHDEDEENLGAKNASSVSSKVGLPNSKGDAKSVMTQAMEQEEVEGETMFKNIIPVSEAVTVKKQNYSFGKMITVHHGSDTSYPLHPEHQQAIAKLKPGEKTSFKDETKTNVTAHREGDQVHLSSNKGSTKTTVAHSHFTENYSFKQSEEGGSIQSQLSSIFGEELSEEFKTRATSIFEAAVIARVNSEMDRVTSKLEEQSQQQLEEHKAALVEKVDSYINYVVEQWMEENALAVESGLRTEIAEDFITGLKSLFQEHYIDVPEEKYDVLEQLQAKSEELEADLNEAINQVVATSKELSQLKQAKVFEDHTSGLAATEVEKLKKLVEGVEFENENLYSEKVAVIKENYFPKTASKSPEKFLVEESGTNPTAFDNSVMTKYVQSLSRTVKTR